MKCSGVVSFFKSLTQLNRKEGKYFTLFIFFQIKARLKIREQQRQVSKVLLDGLYDPDSPISKLLGVRTEVVGEIIWQELVQNWQIFPGQLTEGFCKETLT